MEQIVINQVIIFSLLIGVGVLVRKLGILSPPIVRGLSEILVNLVLPFQIIASFTLEFSHEMLINGGIMFLGGIIIHILAMLTGEFLFRSYPPRTSAVFRFVTAFSNCGYVGLPILDGLYGYTGVFYGSFYIMTSNLFAWTRGLSYFRKRHKDEKIVKLLQNPGTVSLAVGLLLFIVPFKLPAPIIQTIKAIGSMNAPLSMLVIGSTLAEINLSTLFTEASTYYVSLVRLLLLPILVAIGLYFLTIPLILTQILILLTAMPAAAQTAIFAEKYNGDTHLASKSVFITTIFSLVTIPLIIILLKLFGLSA